MAETAEEKRAEERRRSESTPWRVEGERSESKEDRDRPAGRTMPGGRRELLPEEQAAVEDGR